MRNLFHKSVKRYLSSREIGYVGKVYIGKRSNNLNINRAARNRRSLMAPKYNKIFWNNVVKGATTRQQLWF